MKILTRIVRVVIIIVLPPDSLSHPSTRFVELKPEYQKSIDCASVLITLPDGVSLEARVSVQQAANLVSEYRNYDEFSENSESSVAQNPVDFRKQIYDLNLIV